MQLTSRTPVLGANALTENTNALLQVKFAQTAMAEITLQLHVSTEDHIDHVPIQEPDLEVEIAINRQVGKEITDAETKRNQRSEDERQINTKNLEMSIFYRTARVSDDSDDDEYTLLI